MFRNLRRLFLLLRLVHLQPQRLLVLVYVQWKAIVNEWMIAMDNHGKNSLLKAFHISNHIHSMWNKMEFLFRSHQLISTDIFNRNKNQQLSKEKRLKHAVDDLCEKAEAELQETIYNFCEEGQLEEAVEYLCKNDRGSSDSHVYGRLLQACIDRGSSDSHVYGRLLQACIDVKGLTVGETVHAHMLETGFKAGMFVGNRLIDMYAKCGCVVNARRVFDEMSGRNVFSWNTMIAGYVNYGRIEEARQLFDKIPQRNLISWNSMIAGFSQNGCGEEAMKLFCQMQGADMKLDRISFVGVLNACASVAALELGKQVHACIFRTGFVSNVIVNNALIDMYGKCGEIGDAHRMFDRMPEQDVVSWTAIITAYTQLGEMEIACDMFDKMPQRNIVSWNAVIAGYAQRGYGEEALKLFWRFLSEDVKPNQFTFVSVLSACACLAALESGRQVHGHILRTGFQFSIFVENALVDMYAKSGNTVNAQKLFDKMYERDVVSWNAMISGYAQNGCGNEAFQLFEKMLESGMKPNEITFMGILSACSHVGLVEEGRQYFRSMSQQHSVTPRPSHYAIMIDILGRAGYMDEVEYFIDNAPFEPDISMWGALLGVCRIHCNVELGKRAAECLFELEPHNAARYVSLSNLYATMGMWDRVAEVRKLMKDKGVRKVLGCSWIEVRNRMHVFSCIDG